MEFQDMESRRKSSLNFWELLAISSTRVWIEAVCNEREARPLFWHFFVTITLSFPPPLQPGKGIGLRASLTEAVFAFFWKQSVSCVQKTEAEVAVEVQWQKQTNENTAISSLLGFPSRWLQQSEAEAQLEMQSHFWCKFELFFPQFVYWPSWETK